MEKEKLNLPKEPHPDLAYPLYYGLTREHKPVFLSQLIEENPNLANLAMRFAEDGDMDIHSVNVPKRSGGHETLLYWKPEKIDKQNKSI